MSIDAVGVLGLKMVRPGGITSNRKVIEMAELLNVPCYMNSAAEMGIAKAAALHFAFSHNNIQFPCEIDLFTTPEENMIHGSFETDDGFAFPPRGPGLGVTIDEENIKKYLGEVRVCTERKGIIHA
jgi:muconate cycloisomerase